MRAVTRYGIPVMLLGLGLSLVYILMSAAGSSGKKAAFQDFARGSLEGLDFTFAGDVPAATAFLAPDRTPIDLQTLQGKPILVNLWATWCGPCEREMPGLGALQRARGGARFDIIAISVDDTKDGDFAREELARLSGGAIDFYHAPDYAITYTLGARGFPTSVLYDAEGREVARLAGEADWTTPEAVGLIDALIAAASDS